MNSLLSNSLLQLRDYPHFWPVALVPLLVVVFTAAYYSKSLTNLMRYQHLPLVACSFLATAAYGYFAWLYASFPGYLDHLEPTIASVSWYFWNGEPVYHGPHAVERYNMLYGPYLYVFNGVSEGLLGPTIFSSKIAGVASALTALLLLFVTFVRKSSLLPAILVSGSFVALLLHFGHFSFWDRADPFQLLFVALGAFATTFSSCWVAILLGLSAGVCANLKIHSVIYFLPLAVLAFETRRSVKRAGIFLLSAGAAALLPFLVLPNMSLSNYLLTLGEASQHGFDPIAYRLVLEWLGVMLFPLAALCVLCSFRNPERTTQVLQENSRLIGATLLGCLLLMVPASKIGAGPHHWMPYMAVVALVALQLQRTGWDGSWQQSRVHLLIYPFVISWLLSSYAAGFLSVGHHLRSIDHTHETQAQAIVEDMRSIIEKYGKDYVLFAGVGADNDYDLTYYRPLLVFAGMPVGIDPAALMESQQAGAAPPDLHKLMGRFQGHRGKEKGTLWIIPKHSRPFSMATFYPSREKLYDPLFRAGFLSDCRLLTSSTHFDIYVPHSIP